MKFSMTGKEKKVPFNTGDCLIEVTTQTGLTTCNQETLKSFMRLKKPFGLRK